MPVTESRLAFWLFSSCLYPKLQIMGGFPPSASHSCISRPFRPCVPLALSWLLVPPLLALSPFCPLFSSVLSHSPPLFMVSFSLLTMFTPLLSLLDASACALPHSYNIHLLKHTLDNLSLIYTASNTQTKGVAYNESPFSLPAP